MYRKAVPFIALMVLILAIAAGGSVFALSRGSTEPVSSGQALAPSPANAPLTKLMSFQGLLADSNGAPVNGQVQVTFRVHPTETGGAPVWEETQTISATDGLFTALLGGTTPLSPDIFPIDGERWMEIEVAGGGPMVPRLAVSRVPYAFSADRAADAGSVDGLDSTQFLRSDASAFFTIGTLSLDAGTTLDVNGTLRMDGPVTKGSTDLVPNLNADLLDGKDSSAFAPAGSAQTNVANALAPYLRPYTINAVATGAGRDNSMAIGTDGLPVISFRSSSALSNSLNVAHCDDPVCSSATITTLETAGTFSATGLYSSIAIGERGRPVISYQRRLSFGTDFLRLAYCDNIECTSATISFVDTGDRVGQYTSVAVQPDGHPVISYYDGGNSALKVADCNDAGCTTARLLTLDSGGGTTGLYTSIALGPEGTAAISYYNLSNGDLRMARCFSSNCHSGAAFGTVDSVGDVGRYSSIAFGAVGNPIIAYYDATNRDLKAVQWTAFNCTQGNATTVDSFGDVGEGTSIAIGADGLPIISYYDASNGNLKVARCDTSGCVPRLLRTVDRPGDVGERTSITIGEDGLPVISYYDATNFDVKVLHCARSACTVP